jgi:hypothetical protein
MAVGEGGAIRYPRGLCYNSCMSFVVRRSSTLWILVSVAAMICAFYIGTLYEGARANSVTPSGFDKRSPAEQRSARINALKADPSLPINDVHDLETVLPDAERIQLYEAARAFVAQHSIQGAAFSLMFEFKKGDLINSRKILSRIMRSCICKSSMGSGLPRIWGRARSCLMTSYRSYESGACGNSSMAGEDGELVRVRLRWVTRFLSWAVAPPLRSIRRGGLRT